MKYHSIYFWLFVFFLSSCTSKINKREYTEQFTYADFPSKIQLSGEKFILEEEPLNPIRIFLSDTILFVQNVRSEVHMSLYNIKNQTKITDCFLFGNGPHEMIAPTIISFEDGIVHILDKPKMKLYAYETASLCNKDLLSINEVHFNSFPNNMILLKDKIAAIIYAPDHERITFYSMQGDSITTKGKFPTDKKLKFIEQLETYQCDITTNKAKNKIYLFYRFTDLIEIYDQYGILLKSIQGPDSFLTEFTQVNVGDGAVKGKPVSEDIYGAYFFPINVDGNIFVLYSGKQNNMNNPNSLLNQILVFDESGNPLKIYNLDIPIFNMTINAVDRIIYGITMNPEPEIIKYHF